MIEAPAHLAQKVLACIAQLERRRMRLRAGIGSAVSGAAFLFVLPYAVAGFLQSGFGQYLSLLFTDGGAVLGHWQDFALSLAESFPSLEVAGILASIFFGLEGLHIMLRTYESERTFAL